MLQISWSSSSDELSDQLKWTNQLLSCLSKISYILTFILNFENIKCRIESIKHPTAKHNIADEIIPIINKKTFLSAKNANLSVIKYFLTYTLSCIK